MINAKNYPFTKCENPQKIRNPHTGEWLTVPCGQCAICKRSKASTNSLKCKLESANHKYCMFVTLTYDEENIPRVELIEHPDYDGIYECVLVTERLCDGEILFDIELDDTAILYLSEKFQNTQFPILWKRDAQLFIKRLRKHLNKFTDEKIRYYIIGEYGPRHYRPHYHALIWFDEPETFEVFGECLNRSWKLGRMDYSMCGSKGINYVAQYVNSSVKLPRIFTFDETEPFALHSFYLGEAVLATKSKDIPQEEFKDFVRRGFNFSNGYTEFSVWRSFESRFFPKCVGFGSLNESQRLTAYRAYECAREWTGKTALVKQTKDIVSMLMFGIEDDFFDVLRVMFGTDYNDADKLYRQIYLALSISKHFLNNVCRNNSLGEIKNRISYIESYYDYKESEALKNQLLLQSEMLSDNKIEPFNVSLFYDQVEPNSLSLQNEFQPFVLCNYRTVYEESLLVRQFRAESIKICNNSIKHKTLNDLNNIFTNF